MLDAHSATLLVGAESYPLEVVPSGSGITMDDNWAPRVQATLAIGFPGEDVFELLDTRSTPRPRVRIVSSATYSEGVATTRTFDLLLVGRDRNLRGNIALTLESDERLLQDDRLVDDESNLDGLNYQHSLRALINSVVLSRIGATLEAGSDDSTFYVLSNETNLMPNPTLRTAVGAWVPGGANGTLVRATNLANPAVPGVTTGTRTTWSGASGLGAGGAYSQTDGSTPFLNVTAGRKYRISCWAKSLLAASVNMNAQWFSSAGANLGSIRGATKALPANVWTKVTQEHTAIVNAGRMGAFLYKIDGQQWNSADRLETMAWKVVDVTDGDPTPGEDDYYDGDTPDTEDYAYQWTGTANASSSTRISLIDRSPDMLDWEPGRSAWEFVTPLVQAAGLRLFCDEARRWRLVSPSYIAEGVTQLSVPNNLAEATDRISLEDDEFYDAAVVRYRWRNFLNEQEEAIDYYASPGYTKVRTFELERPYPGPGAAEYFVRRAEGKGRTLKGLETMNRFSAEPCQPTVVTLPDMPIQTGLIARVRFDLGSGVMTIDTRGLTDTPPGSWLFGPVGKSWAELPVGMSWAEFDWSL